MFDPVLFAALMSSTAAFTPLSLFSSGEQGAWYDPSDFSTMFQDSAGTIPVTAVEQPVGLIRDKSGRGNHASQSTAASRPVLSARVNLLTYSEQFDNAVWGKANLNTTGTPAWVNVQTAPDGTMTADKLIESNTTAQHYVSRVPTVTSGLTYTLSVYLKAEERTWAFFEFYAGIPAGTAYVNLSTLAKGTTTGSASALTVTDAGSGWRRIELPGFVASSTTPAFAVYTSTGNGVNSYAGDGSSGIYIWGADLRVTNVGVNLPAYQRVAAATDYDTGFPLYLKFDGVDDSLATGTIDPGAVDKAQVFAGVRRLTDTAGVIAEMSSNWNTSAGSFLLWGGTSMTSGLGSGFNSGSRGDVSASASQAGISPAVFTPPATAVFAVTHDIAGDLSIVRGNGAAGTNGTADKGTGNFLSYPLYIGRRGGSSLPFNGQVYSMILRFSAANLSDAQIALTETYVNSKTGAY